MPVTNVFSPAQRREILDRRLMAMSSTGARIVSREYTWAVVNIGRPVNHVLHLLISVFTCTGWLPVWLLMTAFAGQRQTTVEVNEYGSVFETKAPMEAHRIIAVAAAAIWLIIMFVFWVSFMSAFSEPAKSSSMSILLTQ